jgi:hypothetical protein
MTDSRERQISEAFVGLADAMVQGVEAVDLFGRLTADCARLLDIASAGLLLADSREVLHVVAASSERTRNLELYQLQREQGPCLDSYRDGVLVLAEDLSAESERWPQFVAAATQAGFASVHALPLRLQGHALGTLGLFGSTVGRLNQDDLALGQALAHVACIALVAERAAADVSLVNEQLHKALTSRVLIEQAKGVLSQVGGLEMDDAFATLQRYARDNNQKLTDIARRVVDRQLRGRELLDHAVARGVLSGKAGT